MPMAFDLDSEYTALTESCAIWDVAAERQVELKGPDAERLANILTCRDIEGMSVGECRYAIMCDDKGTVINDPVLLKLAEDRFWFSIADSDVLLWAQAHATSLGLNVEASEPDASPLAVQGPKSLDLMKDLFGHKIDIDKLKYFWFIETTLDGIPLLLARSGWSPELGYELYLMDSDRGLDLWDKVWEAGQKYNIVPGAPNQERRIEGGMISYRGDTLPDTNALELGLPKRFVDTDQPLNFIGKLALKKIKEEGVKRKFVSFTVHSDEQVHRPPYFVGERLVLSSTGPDSAPDDGKFTGVISAISSSRNTPDGQFLALGTVPRSLSKLGSEFKVKLSNGSSARAVVDKYNPLPDFMRKPEEAAPIKDYEEVFENA